MVGIDSALSEQAESAGRAARALLTYGLAGDANPALMKVAIETCCLTAPLAPSESVGLLRKCLSPDIVEKHGYEYLASMTAFFPQVVEADERLALDAVLAIGEAQTTGDEWVPFGSRVLPMRVTKRDMLGLCSHHLESHFGSLIRKRLVFGIKLFFAIVDNHIRTAELKVASPSKRYIFDLHGARAAFWPDGSFLWAAEGRHREHELWFKVSAVFRQAIQDASRSDPELIELILETFRDGARWALLWNQLLIAATEGADTLGVALVELLCAPSILAAAETRVSVGRLLAKVYPHLQSADRTSIEAAIVGLSSASPDDELDSGNNARDRLLGCLPDNLLETDVARSARSRLDAQGGAPKNSPPFEITSAGFISEEEWLEMQGVELKKSENARFKEVLDEVKRFSQDVNGVPSLASARAIRARLDEMERSIAEAVTTGIDKQLWQGAADYVYACCEVTSRADDLHEDAELYSYVRRRLLEASVHSKPGRHAKDDENWDERTAGWGSPLPRVDAAQGLMNLARDPKLVDSELLGAIERLSRDPVNAVRHQIASGLLALRVTATELFWRIAAYFGNNEERIAVLHFFLDRVLLRLPREDRERADSLVRCIYNRMVDHPKSEPIRERSTVFFLRRALRELNEDATAFFDEAIRTPIERSVEIGNAATLCRDLMTSRKESGTPEENARVRQWAFSFLRRAFGSINTSLKGLLHNGAQNLTEAERPRVKTLSQLEDRIVHEVYFASEAFEAKQQGWQKESEDVDEERRLRQEQFARDADALLEVICQTPLTDVAYTVLQTLQHLRHTNPTRIFLLIGELVRSSSLDHSHHEPLIADRIVEVVEQYLAEERGIFRDNKIVLETLMDLLDLFVEVGWPKAMALTYRLDEAVRG